MPFSRSPDISRHMLLSMSRLHILWYSVKTVNGKERFQLCNKRGHWMASFQWHFSAGHYREFTLVWTSQGLILCYQPFTCYYAPSSLPRAVLFIKGLDQESTEIFLGKLWVPKKLRKYSGSHTHPFPPYKYLACQQHIVKVPCSY